MFFKELQRTPLFLETLPLALRIPSGILLSFERREYHIIRYLTKVNFPKEKIPSSNTRRFFPFFPPLFIMHFIFSMKFGLINYRSDNYNPLVLLQSPSEELRAFYKYKHINRPNSPAGKRQLLSSEAGAPGLPGLGLGAGCWVPGAWAAWSPLWESHLPEALKAKGLPGPWLQGHQTVLQLPSSKIRGLSLVLFQAIPQG